MMSTMSADASLHYRYDPYSTTGAYRISVPLSHMAPKPLTCDTSSTLSPEQPSLECSSRPSSEGPAVDDTLPVAAKNKHTGKRSQRKPKHELTDMDSSASTNEIADLCADLMHEHVDKAVERRVNRIKFVDAVALVDYLFTHPALLDKLAFEERGNLIYHLMLRLGGDRCHCLSTYAIAKFDMLSLHQSGCITLSRVMECAAPADLHVLMGKTLDNFFVLAPHMYGNYVVQAALAAADDEFCRTLGLKLGDAGVLKSLTGNKFGSHVVERFLQCASLIVCVTLVQSALRCNDTLVHLTHDRFANYVLQAMLGRLTSCNNALLLRWVHQRVTSQLQTSPHCRNIRRHLSGFRM